MDKKTIAAMGLASALSFGAGALTTRTPDAPKPVSTKHQACVCTVGPPRLFTPDQAGAECEWLTTGSEKTQPVKEKGMVKCD